MAKPAFDPSQPYQVADGPSDSKPPFDPTKPYEVQRKESGPDSIDKGRAALEGFADSSSFGTLPYLKAAGEVATDWAAEKLLDAPEANTPYSQRVDKFRAQGKELQDKAPGYALAGQLAGFVAPGAAASKLVGKGLGVIAQGATRFAPAAEAIAESGNAARYYKAAQAAKAAGNIDRAATLMKAARADLALQGAKLGMEGAALGAAYTPESGFSDVGARIQNAATNAAFGTATPFALRGAGNVIRGTGNGIATAGKKALSVIGKVDEEVINRYLTNPERIRNADSFDDLYEKVTTIVSGLQDDLDNARVDYDTAKNHLDEVARGIKESRVEGKAKALEEVRRAQASLDESFKLRKQALTDKANPTRIEPLIEDALGNQKSRVSQGSSESFKILEQQGGTVNVDDLANVIDDIENKQLYIGKGENRVLKSDSADKGARLLDKWRTKLYGLADESGRIPLRTLKEVLQGIDSDLSDAGNKISTSFSEAAERAMYSLRSGIDQHLKDVGDYANKMAEVSSDSTLLGKSNRIFGNNSTRLSRLANIGRLTANADLEILQALAAREGGVVPQTVDDMVKAQQTLRSPTRLETLRQALPENQAVRQAEGQLAVAKRMAKPQAIREAVINSAANFKAQSAKAKLEAAKEVFNRFKGFGEQGAEAKLQAVARGKQYATNTLEELSKLADEDFVEAVHAASDAAAFTKTAFNGSRNVNLWTIMGMLGTDLARASAGAGAGFIFGGPVGMAFGAAMGATMDVYGPRITKKILDGVIKVKGPITEKAIMALDVPEPVKAELAWQFKASVLAGRAASNASEAHLPKVAEKKELDRESGTPSTYRDDGAGKR